MIILVFYIKRFRILYLRIHQYSILITAYIYTIPFYDIRLFQVGRNTSGTESSLKSPVSLTCPLTSDSDGLKPMRLPVAGSTTMSTNSSSIDGDLTSLYAPLLLSNKDAGLADDPELGTIEDPPFATECVFAVVIGFAGGRFSLMNSIIIGVSYLMDTRFSVFTLPECFRMESRRGRTGEVAWEGHALTEMYA